jgi:protein arginine kinase activator
MNCDFCHKNEATIHLIKIQGASVEKINICKECAKDFSFFSEEDFYNDLARILYKFFHIGTNEYHSGRDKKILRSISYGRNRKCSFCGIDLKTIKKIGRVGCSNCYSEFKDVLFPIIRSIQGSLENKGKIPVNTSRKIKLEKNIRDLRHRLKNEIMIENFEEAAKIRDRIKKLEKNIYGQ